jgi:hypothetical protein
MIPNAVNTNTFVVAQLYPERKRRNAAPQLARAYRTCTEVSA